MTGPVDYAALGLRIRRARKKAHLTQTQLAQACALSASFVGHIERGSRALSVETLCNIAKTLQVSTDYLLFDSQPQNSPSWSSLNEVLQKKDPDQVKRFWNIARLLADHIDQL